MSTTEPAIPGLDARRAALKLLDGVLRQGLALDGAAPNATRGLAPADRALAVAIASETCRWLIDLDALIDSATALPLADDAKARMVLRLALAQALRLETPHHAVVSTALPLVAGGPRRLVHGVLGGLLRRGVALPPHPTLPRTVTERWRAQWGDAMVAGAAAALAVPPPIDISLRDAGDAAGLEGTSHLPGHIRLPRSGDVAAMAGFADGGWWVQDIAASLPARLLGAGGGRSVLDVGAAPGGKTMQLAAAGWRVTALDASARRLQRLAQNLERTGLEAEIMRADARALPAERRWDAVLLDAPCSATGIFRRHPDVLHRVSDADIVDRAALQAELLDAAAAATAPGGTLIYAVCSLERSEGEDAAAAFLERHEAWRVSPIAETELPAGISPDANGALRVMPPVLADAGGADGFYIVRLTAP